MRQSFEHSGAGRSSGHVHIRLLAAGEGAELRRPMALTVMAGLSSATLLTLLIIPMVYYLFGGRDRLDEATADAAASSDTVEQA